MRKILKIIVSLSMLYSGTISMMSSEMTLSSDDNVPNDQPLPVCFEEPDFRIIGGESRFIFDDIISILERNFSNLDEESQIFLRNLPTLEFCKNGKMDIKVLTDEEREPILLSDLRQMYSNTRPNRTRQILDAIRSTTFREKAEITLATNINLKFLNFIGTQSFVLKNVPDCEVFVFSESVLTRSMGMYDCYIVTYIDDLGDTGVFGTKGIYNTFVSLKFGIINLFLPVDNIRSLIFLRFHLSNRTSVKEKMKLSASSIDEETARFLLMHLCEYMRTSWVWRSLYEVTIQNMDKFCDLKGFYTHSRFGRK